MNLKTRTKLHQVRNSFYAIQKCQACLLALPMIMMLICVILVEVQQYGRAVEGAEISAESGGSAYAQHIQSKLNAQFLTLEFVSDILLDSDLKQHDISKSAMIALRKFSAIHPELYALNILSADRGRILWSTLDQSATPLVKENDFTAIPNHPNFLIGPSTYAGRFNGYFIAMSYRVQDPQGKTLFYVGSPYRLEKMLSFDIENSPWKFALKDSRTHRILGQWQDGVVSLNPSDLTDSNNPQSVKLDDYPFVIDIYGAEKLAWATYLKSAPPRWALETGWLVILGIILWMIVSLLRERELANLSLQQIANGISSGTDNDFYQKIVLNLAKLFRADMAFIGILDEFNPGQITTLALYAQGSIRPNMSYAIAGMPCEQVIGHQTRYFSLEPQARFPFGQLLSECGARAYLGAPLQGPHGEPLGLIVLINRKSMEISKQQGEILEIFTARANAELQRIRAEAHIRRLAYEDQLTGMANRSLLVDRLSEALSWAGKSGTYGALLLIDLDHFKTINDALGHHIGDDLLKAVSQRLKAAVEEDVLLARLGGDEFVALINPETTRISAAEERANELAHRILDILQAPLFFGERSFTIGASIGGVIFPKAEDSAQDILRHADMALYKAKDCGRGNTQFFVPAMQTAATVRMQLEEGLRLAIVNQELELYYQPQVNASGQLVGTEALLRWNHPQMGVISPAEFIPIAEETGLIHSIGHWVFNQACIQLDGWLEQGLPFFGHLAINVSPWQFIERDFVDRIREIISLYEIDPRYLMLEVTESALLYDRIETIDKLKTFRNIGFQISLDDFGTGYSSLSYLKDLPLDQIKIDKSFIDELDDRNEHPLIESILVIGRQVGLVVIAEGVETEKQHNRLIEMGGDGFQGYLFSRPLPEKEFVQWIISNDGLVHPRGESGITPGLL